STTADACLGLSRIVAGFQGSRGGSLVFLGSVDLICIPLTLIASSLGSSVLFRSLCGFLCYLRRLRWSVYLRLRGFAVGQVDCHLPIPPRLLLLGDGSADSWIMPGL